MRRPLAIMGGDELHNVAVLEAILESARSGNPLLEWRREQMTRYPLRCYVRRWCGPCRRPRPHKIPKDYPNHPIHVVVPSPPGGPPDLIIRLVGA